jgi:hypothetical protein
MSIPCSPCAISCALIVGRKTGPRSKPDCAYNLTSAEFPPVQPGHYEIRIKEPIGEKWLAWFDEFTIASTESGETLLTGPIADQSALHGLLTKVRDLNLTLISVNRIEMKNRQGA